MNTVDNSLYNNDWYGNKIGASRSQQVLWYFFNVLFFINPLNPSSALKKFILKLFGAKIGKGVVIKPRVNIKYPWKLFIGDHSWIGEKVWIDNLANVVIGKSVCISQGAMLLTGNHNYAAKEFDLMVLAISVEDGVWLGAKSVVCPGVTCKTHSVLSVQSVATKNLEGFTIYQGNPAVAIKDRIIQGKKEYKA
jgi:putative colanic acid biosynthesis acetyltransferase WcaF